MTRNTVTGSLSRKTFVTALIALLAAVVVACGSEPSAGNRGTPSSPGSDSAAPGGDRPVASDPDECGPESPAGDDRDSPVSFAPCPPGGQGRSFRLVEPQGPGLSDVHTVPWDDARVSGRTVTVLYYSGVEPCNVLDHVTVHDRLGKVVITLYEGTDRSQGDVACIEIAERKGVRITLDSALGDRRLIDGADP